jgi:DNA-binding winged helix-turn-helix (wHTH) protein
MVYAFEDYQLDVQRCKLCHAGKLVKLAPQVLNVLAYLIQHRDRLVPKEELLTQLWPGRFVTEATLTSRLMAAHWAVGDRGGSDGSSRWSMAGATASWTVWQTGV